MSDPFLVLGRIVMILFVPVMLLAPTVFVLLVPNRTAGDAERLGARARLLWLGLATFVAGGLWAALLVVGIRWPIALTIANFAWIAFFPLWFLFAMPAVRARNPALGGAAPRAPTETLTGTPTDPMHAIPAGAVEGVRDTGAVRTASLVNRERRSPVTRGMWWIPALVFLAVMGAIAARGLLPFPMRSHGSEDAAFAWTERWRWMLALGLYGGVVALHLVMLPISLRRALVEPEPMSPRGSDELAELYGRQRRRRVLGLFWGAGVLLPAFLGIVLALPVWFPDAGGLWALLGAGGGVALGIGGAVFGTMMTLERAKIAEVRARLERG